MICLKTALNFVKIKGVIPSSQMILLHLIYYISQSEDNQYTCPAEKISNDLGCSMRSLQRNLYLLRDRGIISILKNKNSFGKITANTYKVNGWEEFCERY